MMFDVERFFFNIDSSFQQGGAEDFRDFLGRHMHSNKWIIASDYNTGSKGAEQDVYSFALYPTENGLEPLIADLSSCFPRDFKETTKITREQKRYFRKDLSYCFVFMVSRESKFLRTGDHKDNMAAARSMISDLLKHIEQNGTDQQYIRRIRMLLSESKKSRFSLYLFERVLMLSMLNAYVAAKLALNMPVELISWMPDEDDMTTYQMTSGEESIFNIFTHINFYSLWQRNYPNRPHPELRFIDFRSKEPGLRRLRDELIRVPDFMSAVLSRWLIKRNVVSPPEQAKRPAMTRYIRIMKHWLTENSDIWIANCRLEDGGLTTGRIVTAKSRKRLSRLLTRQQARQPSTKRR